MGDSSAEILVRLLGERSSVSFGSANEWTGRKAYLHAKGRRLTTRTQAAAAVHRKTAQPRMLIFGWQVLLGFDKRSVLSGDSQLKTATLREGSPHYHRNQCYLPPRVAGVPG